MIMINIRSKNVIFKIYLPIKVPTLLLLTSSNDFWSLLLASIIHYMNKYVFNKNIYSDDPIH